MTRDFANKGSGSASKKKATNASRRQQAPAPAAPWPWFMAGLLCGVFLSGLVWLAAQQPDSAAAEAVVAGNTEAAAEARPKPRFDFYTLLPEQRIDVEIDPEAMANTTAPSDVFLLQAGSFKQAEDADRRRAQLLLLGLTATVEEATTDNGRWFRVYIGPFESRSALQSARNRTAQEGIDTLLLKRPAKPAG